MRFLGFILILTLAGCPSNPPRTADTGSTADAGPVADSGPLKLGDLTVSLDRIPKAWPFDESVYLAAQQWPEIDATCTAAPCASGRNPVP
jgi:hypothetical protein